MTHKNKENKVSKAVALRYDSTKGNAPKLIASGKGLIADKIIEIAKENQIPFYKDSALADTLLELNLNQEIPPELYQVIAEILIFVYKTDQMYMPGGK